MKRISFSLILVGSAILVQGCATQSSSFNHDKPKEMQSAEPLISVNTNRLCTVCNVAITKQYPDIKTDSLKLTKISYNSERTKPLSVTFMIVDANDEQGTEDKSSHEIGVVMNEDGMEPMVMRMNVKRTITHDSEGKQTHSVKITSESISNQ